MLELLKKDLSNRARLGRLHAAHGVIETPVVRILSQLSVFKITEEAAIEMVRLST